VAEDRDAGLADHVAGGFLGALGVDEVAFAQAEHGAVGEELVQDGAAVRPAGNVGLTGEPLRLSPGCGVSGRWREDQPTVTRSDGTMATGNGITAGYFSSPTTWAVCSYAPARSSKTVSSGRSRSGSTIQYTGIPKPW
jgi:hypothetical protein